MRRLTKEFPTDNRGNVAVLFGLIISLLLLGGGIAVDYSVAVLRKRQLDSAVDIAVLAGTKAAAAAKAEGKDDWSEIAALHATKMFELNLPPGTNYSTQSFVPVFVLDGTDVSGRGTYTARSATSVMQIFQYENIAISGESKAAVGAPSFVDVHFIVDNSSSMGIGATKADQNKMHAGTGCAFACHQGFGANDERFREAKMLALGATLRIDVMRQSIIDAVTQIKKKKPKNGNIRVALYTVSETMHVITSLNSDLDSVLKSATYIALTRGNNGGSYLTGNLTSIAKIVGTGGTGGAANDRLTYIVFMSDGVDDTVTSRYSGSSAGLARSKLAGWVDTRSIGTMTDNSYLQVFSPAPCQTMQDNKNKVLAIQIKYIAAIGFDTNPVDAYKVDFV